MKCKTRKQFVPTVFAQTSIRPSGAALADHFIVYQADAELLNALVLGTSVIMRGTLAARPAASIAGRLYHASDTDQLYRDNGASWDELKAWSNAILRGTNAARPAAGIAGRIYFTTDSPFQAFRDNGASWDFITANFTRPVNRGDMLAGDASLNWTTLLALGANKTVLRSNGTDPVWSANVVLIDPNGTQIISPTLDAWPLILRPFSDTQVSGILAIQNTAGTFSWANFKANGDILFNTQSVFIADRDRASLIVRPFSDSQTSPIFQVTNAAITKSPLIVHFDQRVGIEVGVRADAGGVKHQRAAFDTGVGQSASVTITWPTAFADNNYTVTIGIECPFTVVGFKISAKSATSITVFVNINPSSGTGTIHAIAFHD